MVFLEAIRGHRHVVTSWGKASKEILPTAVGRHLAADPLRRIVDRDLRVGDCRAARVDHRAGDGGSILGPDGRAQSQD